MPPSGRTRGSQSKHDRAVRKLAKDYENRGYKVKADIKNYSRPPTIGGYRPDLLAAKGGHETMVEVETPDSVNSARDRSQQKAFRQAASRSGKCHFKRVVTD